MSAISPDSEPGQWYHQRRGEDRLYCPECGQLVAHDRGYLKEHSADQRRGDLVTGSSFCDGSNQRPPVTLRTVEFSGCCQRCMTAHHVVEQESYPGSLTTYGGIRLIYCQCGDSALCISCGRELHNVQTGQPADGADLKTLLSAAMALMGENPRGITEMLTPGDQPLWLDDGDKALHSDGTKHEMDRRPSEKSPVVLTDNHVIDAEDGG